MPQQIEVPGLGVVEFPDGMNDDDISAAIRRSMPQQAPGPSIAMDVAKSGGVGLAKGAIGLATMGADAREFNASLLSKGAGALGLPVSPESISSVLRHVPLLGGPTSQQAQRAVEGVTGEFYKPQTTAGEYAQTAGEFAPGIVAGPGGIIRRGISQVVVPALLGETAAQITKGTEAEPYAKAGGSIIGSVLGHRVTAPSPSLTVPKADLKAEAGRMYDQLRDTTNIKSVSQPELSELAIDIRRTLNAGGARPSVADKIHKAIDELEVPATKGMPDVSDLVAARENIKGLLGSGDKNATGARIALDKINGAIERLSPGTMAKLKEADQNWSAFKASEALDKKVASAELRAAGEHSGLNVGNKIMQKAASLLESSEARYLSPQNKAALERVAKGTWPQFGTRMASNLLGGGGGLGSSALGLGLLGTGYATSTPEAMALPVTGVGLRVLNNQMIKRQAANAAAGMRQRSPYGQQIAGMQSSPMLGAPGIPGLSINNPMYRNPDISGGLPPGVLALLLARAGLLPAPAGQ